MGRCIWTSHSIPPHTQTAIGLTLSTGLYVTAQDVNKLIQKYLANSSHIFAFIFFQPLSMYRQPKKSVMWCGAAQKLLQPSCSHQQLSHSYIAHSPSFSGAFPCRVLTLFIHPHANNFVLLLFFTFHFISCLWISKNCSQLLASFLAYKVRV